MKVKVNKTSIRLFPGQPRVVAAEALVTVTDSMLTLDTDLIQRAGPDVERELAAIGRCEVGSAVITTSGRLNSARRIIHAVGPRWGEGSERGKLANVTLEVLRLAERNALRSVALPAISIGTAGHPVENCATTMLTQAIDFTFEDLRALRNIIFCLPEALVFDAFKHELERQIAALRTTDEGRVQV